MIDLRQLRHFVALAETLNYRVAAERLHMAQPPLSASIRRLEEQLGCALFERSRRGTALTAAGAAALDMARRTIVDAKQFELAVKDVASGLAGTLTIGYVSSAAYEVLPKLIPIFRQRYPQIQLRLTEASSERILEAVEQRSIDVGLMRTPLAGPTTATVQFFQSDPLVAALPDTEKWRDRDSISISELADEPFVFHNARFARALVMLICQRAGFAPHVAQEGNGLQTIVSLVQCGLGVALVPSVARQRPTPGVVFKSLDGIAPGLDMGLAMVWLSDEESQLGKRFRELLREILEPIASQTTLPPS